MVQQLDPSKSIQSLISYAAFDWLSSGWERGGAFPTHNYSHNYSHNTTTIHNYSVQYIQPQLQYTTKTIHNYSTPLQQYTTTVHHYNITQLQYPSSKMAMLM